MTKRMMEGRNQNKKGLWTADEDRILIDYVRVHGKGHWNRIAKKTGLKRCGKSCRLRWMNYLSPNVKRDRFSEEEEDLIIRLHKLLGNRWSLIAKRVPGRTDNQVKNYWNTHLSKKLNVRQEQANGIGVSSLTMSKESETASNSDNSTFFGNTYLANDYLEDNRIQKCDQVTQEDAVMKDDVWIIEDAIEMSELMMELECYSFHLA